MPPPFEARQNLNSKARFEMFVSNEHWLVSKLNFWSGDAATINFGVFEFRHIDVGRRYETGRSQIGEIIPPLALSGGLGLITSARTTFASDLIALTEQPNRTLKILASRPPIEIPAERILPTFAVFHHN
jgi:hypothetical protein